MSSVGNATVLPLVEVRAHTQATLTCPVRAPLHELAVALAHASRLLRGLAPDPRRVLLAVHRCTAPRVELAVCMPLSVGDSRPDSELAEIPAGRYLTVSSQLDPCALGPVLPVMRDWVGEHHECVTGPLFLELEHRSLIVRQRLGRSGTRHTMQPLPEDALRILAGLLSP